MAGNVILNGSNFGLRADLEPHADDMCAKIASDIFALRSLAQYFTYTIHFTIYLGVLKTVYFGLIHSHLSYGLILRDIRSKQKIEFRGQKKVVGIMTK